MKILYFERARDKKPAGIPGLLITAVFLLFSLGATSQTTYSFTNAGVTGSVGPSQGAINSAYSGGNLNGLVTSSLGIQSWTVPSSGLYRIELAGAKGGDAVVYYYGANGARMAGDFNLTAGTVLKILVGQMGLNGTYASSYYKSGGGGGGSYVTQSGTLLIAAGGGGGGACGSAASGGSNGTPGLTVTTGNSANGYSGYNNGVAGTNGSGGTGGEWYGGAGGGGYFSNGANSVNGIISYGGKSFLNGGAGGAPGYYYSYGGAGGFGGGAGAMFAGGGGGGYSGGAGGALGYNASSGGGGGGSYNGGTNQSNTAGINAGHGYVNITRLTGVNITQAAPVTCNGASDGVLTATVQGGTPPYTYTWMPGGSNSQTITGLSAGSYTCFATDGASATYTTVHTISQPAPISANVNFQYSTTCFGGSNGAAYMTATGGVSPLTYTWFPYGGNSTSATGLSAGTYTFFIKDNNNCTANVPVTILQPPPIQIVAYASKTSLCMGESVTLVGGGASYYSWTGGVSNGVPFSPVATASYVVTGTNSAGCVGSAYTTVSVNPAPSLTLSGVAAMCAGGSATLFANGASTYTWSNLANTASVVVSPGINTIYTVTTTNSFGCSASASTMVAVYPLPSVTAIVSNSAICLGQWVTFSATGASTYSWSGGISSGPPYYLTSSGNYTVTGTDANGCVNSSMQAVTVHQLPQVAIAGSSTLCSGWPAALVASGAATYSWNTGASSATLTFIPSSNITYTVTGTDANGCSGTTSHAISVLPSPAVTASASAVLVCAGDPVQLSASGALSYTWEPGNILSSGTTVNPTTTTIYTVSGSGSNNCIGSHTAVISVKPSPVLSISSPTFVCSGTPFSMGAAGAQTYTWSTGATTPTLMVSPTGPVTYTVSGTGQNGCTGFAIKSMTPEPLPVLNIAASQTAICAGSSATLIAGGAASYTWLPANAVLPTLVISPSVTTVYTLTGKGPTGCEASLSLQMDVNPLPSVTISGPDTVCSGQQNILLASGALTYSWSSAAVSASILVSPANNTSYTVLGTDINGCQSTASLYVIVLASPVVSGTMPQDTICEGEAITLSASGGLTYMWSTADTSQIISVAPSIGSSYTVTGFGINGCGSSFVFTPNVEICTGLDKLSAFDNCLQVYPNPSQGDFFISVKTPGTVRIYGQAGQLVRIITEKEMDGSRVRISGLARGLYIVMVKDQDRTVARKVIIQ